LERRCFGTTGIPLACLLAAKASRKRAYVYAITKYMFSISQYSTSVKDLEPFRSKHIPVSSLPKDHVTFSHAILAAHSAIEDIGLEIRASSKNPSRINGKWNPVVKAELEKRGLKPVADHRGDYRSFRVKDTNGFDVSITNGTKARRRKTPANAKLPAPAPFEPTGWETLYLDHISFEVPDFRQSAAFYQALLGWTIRIGGGGQGGQQPSQASVQIGDGGAVAGAIIRGNAAARAAQRGAPPPPPPANAVTAAIGHISFGIANWDTDKVREALIKRGVVYVRDGKREPRPDMTGNLKSFHVPDAMGWDLQIGNKIGPNTWG